MENFDWLYLKDRFIQTMTKEKGKKNNKNTFSTAVVSVQANGFVCTAFEISVATLMQER